MKVVWQIYFTYKFFVFTHFLIRLTMTFSMGKVKILIFTFLDLKRFQILIWKSSFFPWWFVAGIENWETLEFKILILNCRFSLVTNFTNSDLYWLVKRTFSVDCTWRSDFLPERIFESRFLRFLEARSKVVRVGGAAPFSRVFHVNFVWTERSAERLKSSYERERDNWIYNLLKREGK